MEKTKLPKLLFVFFLLNFLNTKSQELPKIIPPSPNAASLMKFVDIPVSYATGIPSISVPIYEIKEGEITLPINLAYHAGGVKVEEVASWVGLGWSLNAGGAISRTTLGLPDDTTCGYMYTSHEVSDLADINMNSIEWHNNVSSLFANQRDYQPDVFNFNFGGYSGRFIYNQITNEFLQTPYSNIKITYSTGSNGKEIDSWIFTTPNGFKYYFGKSQDNLREGKDTNSSNVGLSFSNNNFSIADESVSIPNHTTSWYLMDIISPSQDQVEFTYNKQLNIEQLNKTSESYLLGLGNSCSSKGYSASFSQSYVNQTVLDKIEFTNGYVNFNEDNVSRLDLTNSKALKSIQIYANEGLLKKYNLNYDYTISSVETGKWTSLGDATQRRYRLRLVSVEEENSSFEKISPYLFEYNNISLPSRFSNAQDYWGYYNAENSNSSLIPETKINFNSPLFTGDANRTVDTENIKAGVLTKVTYPTGGYAEYIYEVNTASLIISETSTDYNLRNRLSEHNFTFLNAPKFIDQTHQYAYIHDFTIDDDLVGFVSFTVSVSGCSNPTILSDFSCDYLLKIIGVSDPSYSFDIINNSFTKVLPSGDYKIVAIELGSGLDPDENSNFSAVVNWGNDPHPDYLNVGGLRLQKTILNDDFNNTVEKTYDYNLIDSSLSSGYIISTPIFLNASYFNGSCQPAIYDYNITSYNQSSMVTINGNVLGYKNVTESRSDNAKTIYTFSFVGDRAHLTTGSNSGYVHQPDLYSNWKRGELIKREAYKFENGSFKEVETILNEYENVGTTFINDSGVKFVQEIQSQSILNLKTSNIFYSGVSEWHRLKKTTTINHFGTNNIVTEKDYVYNNNFLLASETKVKTSNAKTIISKTYYPDDILYTSSLESEPLSSYEKNAIDRLKKNDLYRIAAPIQVNIYQDLDEDGIADTNELLSLQRTNYKDWGSDIVLPESIETLKGVYDSSNNKHQNRIVYHDYYSNGNVKEVSKADGTHIVYVWGYNEQYPVAKIENGIGISVLDTLSETELDNVKKGNYSQSEMITILNKIRAGLPNSMVTTYTYDPLIGITSITDPRGQTIYYEYDDFNRLEYVKDTDENILSKNEYYYKN